MILYKEIKLDLAAERRRIKNVYTPREQKKLLGLIDLIQAGELKKAVSMVERWPKKYREFIGVELWNILLDIWGGEVYLTKNKLS